jgi:hypothetical protein
MRKRQVEGEAEDATLLAGWMYADLLLGLMVIFLATISFVPALTSGVVMGSGSVGKIAGSNYITGLVLTYDKFDALAIERDVAAFIKNENLSPTSEVMYARIVGGYTASEGSDAGKVRAIELSVKLKQSKITYFENTAFDLTSSDKLGAGTFVLRLTLSPKGAN